MKELELIQTILDKFGPRRAGSRAEFEAQSFFAKELQKFCSKVEHEEFAGALRAKFLALRVFCVIYMLNLVLVLYSPLGAFLLALANAVVFFLHFNSYRHILDFLYPKIKSSNVIGTIEPQGEVKQTVIFSGHMDSTPEFIWWYYLKNTGVKLMLLVGVSFVFIPVFYALIAFAGLDLMQIGVKIAYIFFLCIAPLSAVFFFIHGKKVVPGAQDNLSGVSVSYGAAKQLLENGKSKLQHTRIKVIAFGSEETGLRGSTAYVLRHRDELLKENAVCVNADGIIALEHINVVKAEPACWVNHDKETAQQLQATFKAQGIDAKLSTLPIGATDAASFSRYGLKAVSIVAQPLNGLHPTYHTRLDTIDWLSQDALEKTSSVMAKFALELDEKVKK